MVCIGQLCFHDEYNGRFLVLCQRFESFLRVFGRFGGFFLAFARIWGVPAVCEAVAEVP